MATKPGDPDLDPQDAPDPEAAEGEVTPPSDPPPGEAPKARRSWWRRGANSTEERWEPRSSRCVVMGPSKSGKTLLLMSLRRCADALSHSYADRYIATIGECNDVFKEKIEARLDFFFESGLRLDATRSEDYSLAEFTLHVSSLKTRVPLMVDTRFGLFDGPGELLEESRVQGSGAGVEALNALKNEIANCDTVVLCLRIRDYLVKHEQERTLTDYIQLLMKRDSVKRVVVCFTMYETLAILDTVPLGRQAYRELASRTAAGEYMRDALNNQLKAVNNALRQFQRRSRGGKVWCVPVSSYGFVPDNGGPNSLRVRETDASGRVTDTYILRTLPAPRYTPPLVPNPDRPYDYNVVRKFFWAPFLTLDPFIFIATGDREGTLIHSYEELGM